MWLPAQIAQHLKGPSLASTGPRTDAPSLLIVTSRTWHTAPQGKSQGSEKAILHCPEGQLEVLAKNTNNSHNREGLRKPESSGRNPKGYA